VIHSMLSSGTAAEATVQQRFEAKYLLNAVERELVRDYLAGHTRPDAHDAIYPVTSVYYDSESWTTFRSSLDGERNRFKLRVRTYGRALGAPCYAEVKQRIDRIVTKKRALLRGTLAETIAADTESFSGAMARPENEQEAKAFECFQMLASRLRAAPRAGVRYQREAYQSLTDEPVRITIDTDISYMTVRELAAGGDPRWRTLDHVPAVLEVKFTDNFPYWVRQMIDRFELIRVSLAKYVVCVQAMSREGALSCAEEEALPPWTR